MTDGVTYLDGPRLQRCLIAGLDRLIAEREYLNKINVFPVPDGDTGNNLACTAIAARDAIASTHSSAGEILSRLAEGALDGAQGNSGVILAQFFQGLANTLSGNSRIEAEELAQALPDAAAGTRGALANPREGTIVTVIDAAAEAARCNSKCGDFAKLLPAILEASRIALDATTEQLEELRKAGVVDAGARGLVCILEGCTDYLLHGSLKQKLPEPPPVDEVFSEHHEHSVDLKYRYCTECMVTGSNLDSGRIRQELEALGNSMVIAGSEKRLRIHIHTNEPETIFDLVGEFGEVDKTKADDMIGQARTLVAIVTDSAADISEEVLEQHDIHMVSLRVQFGTDSHLDKTGISPAEFRRELESNPNPPGTSQPTQGDLRRMYEFLGAHFGEILTVSLSSRLSGTHQGTVAAAGRTAISERIRIVDSLNVSVGQGLLALRASQLAESGLRGEKLSTEVATISGQVKTWAMVSDLTNAVRSGRVSPWVKYLADWLRLTPILTNNAGKVGLGGVIFGRSNLANRFTAFLVRKHRKDGAMEFAVAHGHSESADADRLSQKLQAGLTEARCVWQTEIGAALGVHAGVQAVVVAFIPAQPDPGSHSADC
jgi:DegV family protein with EDD domain